RVGIGATWDAVKGRIPALVGISILSFLAVMAVSLGMVFLGVLAVIVVGPIGAVLMVLIMLGVVPVVLWLYARLSLGPAAVVLEKAGPLTGIQRSWALTRGRQVWRVLG